MKVTESGTSAVTCAHENGNTFHNSCVCCIIIDKSNCFHVWWYDSWNQTSWCWQRIGRWKSKCNVSEFVKQIWKSVVSWQSCVDDFRVKIFHQVRAHKCEWNVFGKLFEGNSLEEQSQCITRKRRAFLSKMLHEFTFCRAKTLYFVFSTCKKSVAFFHRTFYFRTQIFCPVPVYVYFGAQIVCPVRVTSECKWMHWSLLRKRQTHRYISCGNNDATNVSQAFQHRLLLHFPAGW